MPAISDPLVVHLVWAPLGVAPLERFLASYRAQPAGIPHRIAFIFKGFDSPAGAAAQVGLLEGLEHESFFYDRPTFDLPAYKAAGERLQASHYCFLNSESVLLAPRWLGALSAALARPGVGVAGATGSYETPSSMFPWRRRRWPRFPNPHVRTNAFMLSRELLRSAPWPEVSSKAQAWELESGVAGLTRHSWSQGLDTCVVGRDGSAHLPWEWPASATFRSGGQSNLLVADNRTREWDEATPSRRVALSRYAWGPDPAAAAAAVRGATARSPA
ncbi:MAG: hypothetical protein QOE87_2203 [Gaiellales bacterium]|nr:hypothetical protein [Gaiellales bacterium]